MAHRTKLTDRAREKFLTLLRVNGNVSESAAGIKVSRTALYEERKDDKTFAAAWDEAVEEAVDKLEGEAWRRAVEGWEEPVFYEGEECGRVKKYSDRMLELLLKGHRPEKYRERVEHSGKAPAFVMLFERPVRDPLAEGEVVEMPALAPPDEDG